MNEDTILVTGGGSGIGRRLAEEFLKRGNKVIISGRRQRMLEQVCAANPGMHAIPLDVQDAAAIPGFSAEIVERFPRLNILVNCAGIMATEDLAADPVDLSLAEQIVATNLLGPIRLIAGLLPHLRGQRRAGIINVTSGLGFVPMAAAPTYSATKAAMHSYSISLRHQLRGTNVFVTEVIPPYVQTTLLGEQQAADPAAMPLDTFIAETMRNFEAAPSAEENRVEAVDFLRFAERDGRFVSAFDAVNAIHAEQVAQGMHER